MPFNEADAYVHAKDGCTTPDGVRCRYCEAEAEAERLEAEIQQDEAKHLRTLELLHPLPALFCAVEDE